MKVRRFMISVSECRVRERTPHTICIVTLMRAEVPWVSRSAVSRVKARSVAFRVLARQLDLWTWQAGARLAPGIAAALIVQDENLDGTAGLETTAIRCKPCFDAWQRFAASYQSFIMLPFVGVHSASKSLRQATGRLAQVYLGTVPQPARPRTIKTCRLVGGLRTKIAPDDHVEVLKGISF